MDLPNFPIVEVAKSDVEIVENPLLETFLQQFITQQMDEITQIKSSCENLKQLKESLQASKDKYLGEIFTLTHSNTSGGILSQQLLQRIQGETRTFRKRGQIADEVLLNFFRDYVEGRCILEQKKQALLAADELIDLSQPELESKIGILKEDTKNTEDELNAFEETIQANNKLLDEESKALNEGIKTLQSVLSDVGTTLQRSDESKEIEKEKNQQDINKLLKEIDDLRKKIELYE
ncbi:PREDICTED: uncharacterized protein LOC108363884 [Rhagoletis zephyria]|uniref:uncharacterized protein LOC108363884 n=1 Tax=Rhagoletis zephyria TaxID=28612 RepID=UPI00081126A5|nr:PREDICTED: uncharacterized protein LOC108363884 [Rhagoletis zephyria]